METRTAKKIAEKVRVLSEEQQEEILEFVDKFEAPPLSLWDMVKDWVENIPEDVLEKLPTDGSHNHDHYLYGAPKK